MTGAKAAFDPRGETEVVNFARGLVEFLKFATESRPDLSVADWREIIGNLRFHL